jgi:hypothetical protein
MIETEKKLEAAYDEAAQTANMLCLQLIEVRKFLTKLLFAKKENKYCLICRKKVNTSCDSDMDTVEVVRYPHGGYDAGDRISAIHTQCLGKIRELINNLGETK